MGSIALDNGESVYIHDGTGSADPVAISAAEGSSVANLMKNRERFDYTWANSTERTGQTGMVQGSRGYQEDTKSEYLYDSSAWRLALPYAEYTASVSPVANSTLTLVGTFSIDSTNSTDSTMASPQTSGILRFANPGIYSISSYTKLRDSGDTTTDSVTSRTFLDLSIPPTFNNIIQRMSIVVGEDSGSLSMPTLRVPSSNYDIQFVVFKNTAITTTLVKTRIRVARLA